MRLDKPMEEKRKGTKLWKDSHAKLARKTPSENNRISQNRRKNSALTMESKVTLVRNVEIPAFCPDVSFLAQWANKINVNARHGREISGDKMGTYLKFSGFKGCHSRGWLWG